MLCYLFFYINLLDLLNLQSLRGWFLTPDWFQTSSPWSRTHTGSQPLAVLILILVFGQLFLAKVCCNQTALRWVACFVAIRPHLDGLLVLGCLSSRWFLVVYLLGFWLFDGSRSQLVCVNCSWLSATLCNRSWLSPASLSSCLLGVLGNCSQLWSIGWSIGWPVIGLISLDLNWLMLLGPFLQSFSWTVQDKIIPLKNYTLTLNLHQNHLHKFWDHLDKPLDFFLLRSLPASTMLQGSPAGVTAVILVQGDLFYYLNHYITKKLPRSNRRSIDKLMLTSKESGLTTSSWLSLSPLFCTVASTKVFINRAKGSPYYSTTKACSSFHL